MLNKKHVLNNGKSIDIRALFPTKDVSSVSYYEVDYVGGNVLISFYDEYGQQISSLPDKEKVYVTESTALYCSSVTTACFDRAKSNVAALFPNIDIEQIKYLEFDKYKDIKSKIDEEYRQQLCALSVSDMELIIKCHDKGKINRADVTIRALKDELARRYIFTEANKDV